MANPYSTIEGIPAHGGYIVVAANNSSWWGTFAKEFFNFLAVQAMYQRVQDKHSATWEKS